MKIISNNFSQFQNSHRFISYPQNQKFKFFSKNNHKIYFEKFQTLKKKNLFGTKTIFKLSTSTKLSLSSVFLRKEKSPEVFFLEKKFKIFNSDFFWISFLQKIRYFFIFKLYQFFFSHLIIFCHFSESRKESTWVSCGKII